MFSIYGLFRYEEIFEIDEKGDNATQFPHLYVPFRADGRPAFTAIQGRLTVNGVRTEPDGKITRVKPRRLIDPRIEDRVERFPPQFRKPFPSEARSNLP
jgi:hypothetical protein